MTEKTKKTYWIVNPLVLNSNKKNKYEIHTDDDLSTVAKNIYKKLWKHYSNWILRDRFLFTIKEQWNPSDKYHNFIVNEKLIDSDDKNIGYKIKYIGESNWNMTDNIKNYEKKLKSIIKKNKQKEKIKGGFKKDESSSDLSSDTSLYWYRPRSVLSISDILYYSYLPSIYKYIIPNYDYVNYPVYICSKPICPIYFT